MYEVMRLNISLDNMLESIDILHFFLSVSPIALAQLLTHHMANLPISSSRFNANPIEMRRKSRRCSR
jgi:hypothetical protein